MPTLSLYTTAGCHLCEVAKSILWPLISEYQLGFQEIDIAESDDLIARYGIRIPVLASSLVQTELGWPFDVEQAREYIAAMINHK